MQKSVVVSDGGSSYRTWRDLMTKEETQNIGVDADDGEEEIRIACCEPLFHRELEKRFLLVVGNVERRRKDSH